MPGSRSTVARELGRRGDLASAGVTELSIVECMLLVHSCRLEDH
jgi:hypothetical protein